MDGWTLMEGLRRAHRHGVDPHPPSCAEVFVEPRAVHFAADCTRMRRQGKVRSEPFTEVTGRRWGRWCACLAEQPALQRWHELLIDYDRIRSTVDRVARAAAAGANTRTSTQRRRLLAAIDRLEVDARPDFEDPADRHAAARLCAELRAAAAQIPDVDLDEQRAAALRAATARTMRTPVELLGDNLGLSTFEHWQALLGAGVPLEEAERQVLTRVRSHLRLHPDAPCDTATHWCSTWRAALDACEESWREFGQHAVAGPGPVADPDDDPVGSEVVLGAAQPVTEQVWVMPAVCAAALCSPSGPRTPVFCDLGELNEAELAELDRGGTPPALEVAVALAGTEWAGVDLLEMGRAALALPPQAT